ncbi:MAG: TerB family tellurite resistance protein [Salaquimonas sp.]
MYSVVKNFLDLLDSSNCEVINFTQDDTRTAIAVLYYRVIVVDGRIRSAELNHFRKVLSETLGVSEDELLLFEEKVLEHVKSETSLFPFTTIVKKLPIEKRLEILEHMKQISISDRELHEFEINLVARTAELLGLGDEWNPVTSSKS